jgi:tRNA G18 (ribose-2'-O)-methylase SpoU
MKYRKRLKKEMERARVRFRKHRQRNLLATPGQHRLIIVLDHLKASYNIPKIFRSAEAMGAWEVHLVGIDHFDPAPAMGAFKHVPARFFNDFDTCYADLKRRDYRLVALTPEGSTPLPQVQLPKRCAVVFGHEEFGLSFDPSRYGRITPVCIPQFGQVQSMNVSNVAAIVMYEYVRRHNPGFERFDGQSDGGRDLR